MAAGKRVNVAFPEAPDLPAEFDTAPARLESRAIWECVEADDSLTTDDVVADAQLRECVLRGVDFVGRRFTGLRCREVPFIGCDLSGAFMEDCRLTRVTFESCRLNGAVLNGAALEDVHLAECNADAVLLRMATVSRSAAERCSMRRADFYQATLREVRLVDGDLTQAVFDGLDAQGLALNGSTVDGIVGAQSLAGAQIDADQVVPIGAALVSALGLRIT